MKLGKYILSAILCVCILPLFVACGPSNETKLTKEISAKVFEQVAECLTPSSSQAGMFAINAEDYEDAVFNEQIMVAQNLTKFLKNICEKETYELTTNIDTFEAENPGMSGDVMKGKIKIVLVDNVINCELVITDNFETPSYHQYLSFAINYSFDTEEIISFDSSENYNMMGNVFVKAHYENGKLKTLKTTTQAYEDFKTELLTEVENFIQAEASDKNYDFSAELASIQE